MQNYTISLMEQGDIEQSSRVLSIAMLNNPIHIGVFQGNDEKERIEIEKMFYTLLNKMPGYVFLVKDNDKIIGVMRMKSCTGKEISKPHIKQNINDLNWRKYLWLKEWAMNDPKDQHWHLGPIGVLPSHQRLGIGSLLMKRFCEEVDACGAKAYLETDLEKNVGFYEKFGFNIVSEHEIFGAKCRYMMREKK